MMKFHIRLNMQPLGSRGSRYVSTAFYVCFFTSVLMLIMPCVVAGQTSGRHQAIVTAEKHASEDVKRPLWFGAGCVLNYSGYLWAQTYHRPVPVVSLLGKSPEYVAFYTDRYREKSNELQASAAFAGCITGGFMSAFLFVLLQWAADDQL